MLKLLSFILCLGITASASAQVYQNNPDGTVSIFSNDGVYISTDRIYLDCLSGTCQQVLVPIPDYGYSYIAPQQMWNAPPPMWNAPLGTNRTPYAPPVYHNQEQPHGFDLPNTTFDMPNHSSVSPRSQEASPRGTETDKTQRP
jgi:hypothetical protein